jgi:hypothetical protein
LSDELDCRTVSRLISQGQDQPLPPRERARLRLHFVLCETCRHVDDQFRFLRDAMRSLAGDAVAPVDKPPAARD